MAVATERFVFYQIPKTGGSWVKRAMLNAGVRHSYCRGIDRHEFDLRRDHATPSVILQRYRRGRYEFCFVRHPVEWYRSFWAYRWSTRRFNPLFPPDQYWVERFEDFVDGVLKVYPEGFVSAMYGFYVDEVDFVGRQENLADDLVKALRRSGEEFDEDALRGTPPRNVVLSGRPELQDMTCVSPELRGRIEDAEKLTMGRFYGTGD